MKTLINFIYVLLELKQDFVRYKSINRNPLNLIYQMFLQPGMIFCVLYRFERFLLYKSSLPFRIIGKVFYPLYFFLTYYVLSYHIEPEVEIGSGLLLHNREITFTEKLVIGANFSCMGQTTIGVNELTKHGIIRISDNVFVGVGAKIIASGDLNIETGVHIGANSVVTKNLAKKNGIYIGIPARLLKVLK